MGERGIIIRGASGAGKSTLGLALIEAWRAAGRFAALVADDRTGLSCVNAALIAAPHPRLAGTLERRGLGFIAPPSLNACRVGLFVDLVRSDDVPRLPADGANTVLLGVQLPHLRLPEGEHYTNLLTILATLDSDGTRTHPHRGPSPPDPASD